MTDVYGYYKGTIRVLFKGSYEGSMRVILGVGV